MNQIKKRLHIIKLAISITDIDCVNYQIPKLRQFTSDTKLQTILDLLQNKNYARAQELIIEYIETPIEKTATSCPEPDTDLPEETLHDPSTSEFLNLFDNSKKEEKVQKIEDIEAFLENETPSVKSYENDIDFDALLSLDANDILPNNIDTDHLSPANDHFFDPQSSTKTENKSAIPTETKKEDRHNPAPNSPENSLYQKSKKYPPDPHIREKFTNLLMQYPPIENGDNEELSVMLFLKKIASEPYTEEDVEKKIGIVMDLIRDGAKAEAAKLLLACACTPSPYAQLMLARALFRGEILTTDIHKSFQIIFHLANHENYPEAICDLAQLYEHGIGIDKNISKAKSLYTKAANMNIKRASKHLKKLNKNKRGLFSRFLAR